MAQRPPHRRQIGLGSGAEGTGSCTTGRPLGPSCACFLGVAEEARSRWNSWLTGWVEPMHPHPGARGRVRPLMTADIRSPCRPLT
eukprot:6176567-Pleurochrysis_carterae.AAC.1